MLTMAILGNRKDPEELSDALTGQELRGRLPGVDSPAEPHATRPATLFLVEQNQYFDFSPSSR